MEGGDRDGTVTKAKAATRGTGTPCIPRAASELLMDDSSLALIK